MGKIDNSFEERLKKYSDHIKSMEIVYHEGRVKCINNKEVIKFKSRSIQSEPINIKSYNTNDEIIEEDEEEYFNIRNTYSFILKIIFTCIALMIMPFIANKFFEIGGNKFISGIGGMFISYFIVKIIWIFLE